MTCRLPSCFLLAWIACALPAESGRAAKLPPPPAPLPEKMEIAPGPFQPTYQSLKQYQCPEWFRDAKLGIWAVWGVCSVPMQGDWNSRNLYIQGSPQYNYHVAHYGHPSKFGYKDLLPLWKAEKWDPDQLMGLYKKAGARYFCALAVFCDNTDYWDSKYNRWNSVHVGPHRDIVGEWSRAARKRGLRFGVSEHLGDWYNWMETSKGADKTGPLAGVSYDGNDPAYADLYSTKPQPANWFHRMTDLVDRYQPDLFYTDGGLPYADQAGRQFLAHYYNQGRKWHKGRDEVVYNCKQDSQGMWVEDLERGVMGDIHPHPWQTDTCVGDWHYRESLPKTHSYRTTTMVLQMLADIVSKNGNLLLNFPPRPDGTLDDDELKILGEMAAWMPVNGEAIFGTRPWQVYGEGGKKIKGGGFNEGGLKYTAKDIRFTTKGDTLYALLLGWPENGKLVVRSLAAGAGKVTGVSLLGHNGKLAWAQMAEGLLVSLPEKKPCESVWSLKITGQDLKAVPLPVPEPTLVQPAADGSITLTARDAEIDGVTPVYVEGKEQIGYWGDPRDFVFWVANVAKPGKFKVTVTYSCAAGAEGSAFGVETGDRKLEGKSQSTGSWDTYRTDDLGTVELMKTGKCTIAVKPKSDPRWKVIGLKSVTLVPAR